MTIFFHTGILTRSKRWMAACSFVALMFLLLSGCDTGQVGVEKSVDEGPVVSGVQGAVASAHPLATAAGVEMLEAGGNAFDAAVAVTAALAVVEPTGSGLGGGGLWLLHREEDGFQVMLDGRERAPLAATSDMYLDDDGEVVPGLSRNGPLAAGIPGEPAALVHLAKNYGQPSTRKIAGPRHTIC